MAGMRGHHLRIECIKTANLGTVTQQRGVESEKWLEEVERVGIWDRGKEKEMKEIEQM